MARPQPKLAKLTRPRLNAPVARARLFRLIDELRSRPIVWIEGPPGAGKTTLAVTYLQEARLPAIWYQMDGGDADPATFFFYLREAVQGVPHGKKALPLLTPEYLGDVPGFGRRFFRDLFQGLPGGAVVVFDNYHEVVDSSPLHEVFAAVVDEIPENANVIVLSRAAPSQALARARVNEKLAHIGWHHLRLTDQETAALIDARGGVDDQSKDAIIEQSNGWVAGVMLLLERMRRDGVVQPAQIANGLEGTFDYFASQIFDPLPAETREMLMAVALFPQVTPTLATRVSEDPAAGRMLELLYRRQLFVDRRSGEPPTYQLHALFRAFLEHRAELHLGAVRLADLRATAAELLVESGQEDDAFPLLVQANRWSRAAALVARLAPRLIAQGRWRTLEEWIAVLPDEHLLANPLLRYWLGRAKAPVDPAAAYPILVGAYEDLVAAGDRTSQLLCAATVLEALIYDFSDLRQMDPWIERTAHLLEDGIDLPSMEEELQVFASFITAANWRDPDHPMWKRAAERVCDLLAQPLNSDLRVSAAASLHTYAQTAVDGEAIRVALREGSRLVRTSGVSPARAAFYYLSEGYSHYMYGAYPAALACFDHSRTIAREHGLEGWALHLGCYRALTQRRAGLHDAAQTTFAGLEQLAKPRDGYRKGLFEFVQGALAADRCDLDRSAALLSAAYLTAERAGSIPFLLLASCVTADILIQARRYEEANAVLERARRQVRGPVTGQFGPVLDLLGAWLAHRQADPTVRDRFLASLLKGSSDDRVRVRLRWYMRALAEVLPVAIRSGVEVQHALTLARELNVSPLDKTLEDWPWSIKVYTLGRFAMFLDQRPVVFAAKTPKKTLALLQAIIAFGGTDIPEERLIDALWPDEDGDAAHRACSTALHRLRKLVRDPAAIRQAGSCLTLDRQRVWVDAFAFEETLESNSSSRQSCGLYRGPFMGQQEVASWALPARERLRGKFVQAAGAMAQEYEREGRLAEAIQCYLGALEADHLVEPFYQGLMRCYSRQGQSAEIVSVYRRLERTLAASLSAVPSPASERMYRELATRSSAGVSDL